MDFLFCFCSNVLVCKRRSAASEEAEEEGEEEEIRRKRRRRPSRMDIRWSPLEDLAAFHRCRSELGLHRLPLLLLELDRHYCCCCGRIACMDSHAIAGQLMAKKLCILLDDQEEVPFIIIFFFFLILPLCLPWCCPGHWRLDTIEMHHHHHHHHQQQH